jgi:predicted DNA-binding transcriptional regulator YafY
MMLKSAEEKQPRAAEPDSRLAIRISYTNYRGETARREIVPQRVWFGATEWHPEEQWLLDAIDLEKGAQRSFALRDIKAYLA